MRIQLQNTAFRPSMGGIETYFDNVSRELITKGHAVSVLCESLDGREEVVAESPRLIVYRHPRLPSLGTRGKLWLFDTLYHARTLRHWVCRFGGDVETIVARQPQYAYASKKAIPSVSLAFVVAQPASRAIGLNERATGLKARIARRFTMLQYDVIERAALRRADQIITLSRASKREIVDLFEIPDARIHVVPPGVDVVKHRPRPRDAEFVQELGLEGSAPVVLCACRLVPVKNVGMLLSAFSVLRNRVAWLVVVGDGPERPALEAQATRLGIRERVRFVGFQPDMTRYLSVADLFVLPSRYENFGHVYLEAMASGLPCIGLRSDYPHVMVATEEIIVDGETGYWADPYSVRDLAERIDMLLANPALRQRMGEAGRQRCEMRYRWGTHVDKLLSCIQPNGEPPHWLDSVGAPRLSNLSAVHGRSSA